MNIFELSFLLFKQSVRFTNLLTGFYVIQVFAEKYLRANYYSYSKWDAHPLKQPPGKTPSYYGWVKNQQNIAITKELKTFLWCLNFILFFSTIASKLIFIVIIYAPFTIIYLNKYLVTFFIFLSLSQ